MKHNAVVVSNIVCSFYSKKFGFPSFLPSFLLTILGRCQPWRWRWHVSSKLRQHIPVQGETNIQEENQHQYRTVAKALNQQLSIYVALRKWDQFSHPYKSIFEPACSDCRQKVQRLLSRLQVWTSSNSTVSPIPHVSHPYVARLLLSPYFPGNGSDLCNTLSSLMPSKKEDTEMAVSPFLSVE